VIKEYLGQGTHKINLDQATPILALQIVVPPKLPALAFAMACNNHWVMIDLHYQSTQVKFNKLGI
jgi:hypothetical protein